MEITVPHYYRKFRCTASACPDTCCAGWEIMIDDRTMKKYRKIRGPFGNRLYNSVNWKKKSFRQYRGRCVFLNEENLCDLYLEGGKDYFCRTCRRYPRHVEEFEDCREISLSLSCMAAAELILGSREKVRFLHASLPEKGKEDYGNFDYFLFSSLLDVRETIIALLQNRSVDAGVRSCMAMGLAHDFQGRIAKKRLGETQELLERYQKPETVVWFEKKLEKYRQGMRQEPALRVFRMLKAMEVLKESWTDELQRVHHFLYTVEEPEYQCMRREWKKRCEEQEMDLSVLREQLLVYYVFTYFAGAVYDGHAYGKMKLAAAVTVLTEEIAMARALSGRKEPAENDFIWTAHLISKEIEHSDQNLNRLEKLLTPVGLEELFTLLI